MKRVYIIFAGKEKYLTISVRNCALSVKGEVMNGNGFAVYGLLYWKSLMYT